MLRFQWERAQLTQLAMYLTVFGALVSLMCLLFVAISRDNPDAYGWIIIMNLTVAER